MVEKQTCTLKALLQKSCCKIFNNVFIFIIYMYCFMYATKFFSTGKNSPHLYVIVWWMTHVQVYSLNEKYPSIACNPVTPQWGKLLTQKFGGHICKVYLQSSSKMAHMGIVPKVYTLRAKSIVIWPTHITGTAEKTAKFFTL